MTPVLATVAHLRKIDCPTDIFCICGEHLRNSLVQAGYNIIDIEVRAEITGKAFFL